MAYVNRYSQNGEEAEILHVFDVLGINTGHIVDLGAGDGYTMSNSRALLDRGWTGDLYDGDPKGAKDVKKVWIKLPTEIVEFGWSDSGFECNECDFLNIDLDGNDYWILGNALTRVRPSLIVAEINPIFQREEWAVMPYDADHVWQGDTWYGMSLAACESLAKTYGYTLIYLHAGINAFLLRNDHAEAHPELIRPIEYRQKVDHRPHQPGKQWIRL